MGLEAEEFEETGGALEEEIGVFEEAEDAEGGGEAEDEPTFLGGGRAGADADRGEEINGRGEEDESEETPIPACVEKIAGPKEEDVLPPMPQQPVDQNDGGKEAPELVAVKEHAFGKGRKFVSGARPLLGRFTQKVKSGECCEYSPDGSPPGTKSIIIDAVDFFSCFHLEEE